MGQLVGCWFPEDGSGKKRGSKFRPCMVIATDEAERKVAVAFGGGQRTTEKHGPPMTATQFELDAREGGNSLSEQTRFECKNYAWLEYTTYWFCKESTKTALVSYGMVPRSRKVEIKGFVDAGRAAADAADVAKAAIAAKVGASPRTKGGRSGGPVIVVRKKIPGTDLTAPARSPPATGTAAQDDGAA